MSKICLLLSSILVANLAQQILANPEPGKILKAVTVRSPPFAYEKDGHMEGFMVDLMDAIAKKTGIEYSLYFSPDGRYGNKNKDGEVNGMIGEVHNGKADMAVADLTVTEAREQLVDFTEPFMVNHLSALVRKEDAIGMESLEDLFKEEEEASKKLSIGSLRSGATFYLLSKSEDPLAKKLHESMLKNDGESMVSNLKEGVDRLINNGGYALLVESAFGEHEVAQNCNLKLLMDKKGLYPRKYALALPKGSPHLEKFNTAIKELKESGEIEKMKQKYWKNNCDDQQSSMMVTTMMTPMQP